MYSFAQRRDTTVVDEPLYAHYLAHTSSPTLHPGTGEILQSMEQDGQKVVKEVLMGSYPTPVVVFKQMTHHLIDLDLKFLQNTLNVILIRDPRYIIASYSKIAPPTMEDIGVAQQLELFHHLRSIHTLNAVVDAKTLLLDPPDVLSKLCRSLGIAFDPKMLAWPEGPRPEDGCWAKYWYNNVHRSTGFRPYIPKKIELPEELEVLAKKCTPYYQELYQDAIK